MKRYATYVWHDLLEQVRKYGHFVAPRDKFCRELLCCRSRIDMNYPVVGSEARRLGYKFMAAEAAWILSGQNKVDSIQPYSTHISKFSDDGYFFFGSYGPKVIDQLPYIIKILDKDQDTRQAVINIWRESPPETKDVPCTLSLQWFIRDGRLHCIATMRSSDLWLGWPYDVFNFSMISRYVQLILSLKKIDIDLGELTLVAGSQHLYEENLEKVDLVLSGVDSLYPISEVNVTEAIQCSDPSTFIPQLWAFAKSDEGIRFLEQAL